MSKKRYYGILIIAIPFVTGMYKNLGNWSDAERVGYNIFTLGIIVFGIYYFRKHRKKSQVDLSQFDLALSKATIYHNSLKDDIENNAAKQASYNEIKDILDLCHKNRKKWKSQQKVDEITADLNAFVEGDSKFIDAFEDIKHLI